MFSEVASRGGSTKDEEEKNILYVNENTSKQYEKSKCSLIPFHSWIWSQAQLKKTKRHSEKKV